MLGLRVKAAWLTGAMSTTDQYTELVELRGIAVARAADILEALVLEPTVTKAQVDRILGGVRPLVVAFEQSVVTAHASSSEAYSMRDLPPEQKTNYNRALHAIKVLTAVWEL